MSCCEGTGGIERFPGTGCCGTSCAASTAGCLASEPRIRTCLCQKNVGCLDRADCGGFRPTGTAATGACPGPCQCAEEEAWNTNVPPKPNCEWLTNFTELRRQWSDHSRLQNCKCCNCKPNKIPTPCRPCLPATPRYSTTTLPPSDCQECCDTRRLPGGASDTKESLSTIQSRPELSMIRREAGGGCPPSGCCQSTPQCPSSSMEDSDNCQPCGPSPRPILKKRSCCQCIGGYCMCQPMQRPCNCPPPIQVDARAERECSCDCPSAPECACPPSERRFPRTKVQCPNARLCCPTPRPQPGPKCSCTRCQPCMPPPCDPCTSNKCRTAMPKTNACYADSPCPTRSPCRPTSPSRFRNPPCRPTTPCSTCRKMAPPCRTDNIAYSGSSQLRALNRPLSPGYRRSGSCLEEDGGDRGDVDMEAHGQQYCCGLHEDSSCGHCCSMNCAAFDGDDDDYDVRFGTRVHEEKYRVDSRVHEGKVPVGSSMREDDAHADSNLKEPSPKPVNNVLRPTTSFRRPARITLRQANVSRPGQPRVFERSKATTVESSTRRELSGTRSHSPTLHVKSQEHGKNGASRSPARGESLARNARPGSPTSRMRSQERTKIGIIVSALQGESPASHERSRSPATGLKFHQLGKTDTLEPSVQGEDQTSGAHFGSQFTRAMTPQKTAAAVRTVSPITRPLSPGKSTSANRNEKVDNPEKAAGRSKIGEQANAAVTLPRKKSLSRSSSPVIRDRSVTVSLKDSSESSVRLPDKMKRLAFTPMKRRPRG